MDLYCNSLLVRVKKLKNAVLKSADYTVFYSIQFENLNIFSKKKLVKHSI